jgi:hypothetical protein
VSRVHATQACRAVSRSLSRSRTDPDQLHINSRALLSSPNHEQGWPPVRVRLMSSAVALCKVATKGIEISYRKSRF